MREKNIFNSDYTIFEDGTIRNAYTGIYLTVGQSKPYGVTIQDNSKKRFLSFPKLMWESFRELKKGETIGLLREDVVNKFSIHNLYSTDEHKLTELNIHEKFKIGSYAYQKQLYYDIPGFKGYKISRSGNLLSFVTNLRFKDIHLIKARGEANGFDLSKLDGSKSKTYYLSTLLKLTFDE